MCHYKPSFFFFFQCSIIIYGLVLESHLKQTHIEVSLISWSVFIIFFFIFIASSIFRCLLLLCIIILLIIVYLFFFFLCTFNSLFCSCCRHHHPLFFFILTSFFILQRWQHQPQWYIQGANIKTGSILKVHFDLYPCGNESSFPMFVSPKLNSHSHCAAGLNSKHTEINEHVPITHLYLFYLP